MQLGRVCGQVVSTKKTEKLGGFKILVVQPVSLETFEDKGAPFVSLDGVGAGDGEIVMCVSGSSSRQTAETDARPVDNLIVAIIDSVDILGKRMFDKADPSIKPKKQESENNASPANQKASGEAKSKPASAGGSAAAAKKQAPAQDKPDNKPPEVKAPEKPKEAELYVMKPVRNAVPAEEQAVETNLDAVLKELTKENQNPPAKPEARVRKPKH